MAILENDHLRVVIALDRGAEIVEFRSKADDADPLLRLPGGPRDPRATLPSIGGAGGSFLDVYAGGWQEILPNGGPAATHRGVEYGQHGEISLVPWTLDILEDESAAGVGPVHASAGLRTPFLLERTMTIRADRAALFLDERLTNESGDDLDLMWGHHVAFGRPFLDRGARIWTSARAIVAEDPMAGFEPRRVQPGHTGAWPIATAPDGSAVDLSVVPDAASAAGREMCYLSDFDGDAWYAIASRDHGFAMRWDAEVFKYLWLWQEFTPTGGYPWWKRVYTVALEPWTSFPTLGLPEAVRRGTQLVLPAGASVGDEPGGGELRPGGRRDGRRRRRLRDLRTAATGTSDPTSDGSKGRAGPMMRVALGQLPEATDASLAFARQLGLSSVQFNTPNLPGERRWEYEDLLALRERCEAAGLTLEAIENIPTPFYMRAMLGKPGRDEDIENVRATIRNVGRAGIPILGYHFMPASVWRTSISAPGRGGAIVTAYDHEIATDPARAGEVYIAWRDLARDDPFLRGTQFDLGVELDEDAMWANYRYFMDAVVPVAEEANVRLALHPDDPPVEQLGGVARLFRSVANLRKATELVPSPNAGLRPVPGDGVGDGRRGRRARGDRDPRTGRPDLLRPPARREGGQRPGSRSASSARATTTRSGCCARSGGSASTASSSTTTCRAWSTTPTTCTAAGHTPSATSRACSRPSQPTASTQKGQGNGQRLPGGLHAVRRRAGSPGVRGGGARRSNLRWRRGRTGVPRDARRNG